MWGPKKASGWKATLSEGQRGPCSRLPELTPALTDQMDQLRETPAALGSGRRAATLPEVGVSSHAWETPCPGHFWAAHQMPPPRESDPQWLLAGNWHRRSVAPGRHGPVLLGAWALADTGGC